MKFKYIIICLLFASLFSCKKGDSYDVSKLTTFATFSNYEPFVVVQRGESFTPSIVAKEGTNTLTATITGSVDVNTVGVYQIVYAATNSDGYDGTTTQTVVVFDPNLHGTDVSGNIFQQGRPERSGTITLVPGTTNIYLGSDMAMGGIFPLYFQMIGDVMHVIPQPFALGITSVVNASYDPVNRSFTLTVLPYDYTYTIVYSD